MKRLSFVLAIVASFALAGTAFAATGGTNSNTLKTFAEGGSVVTFSNGLLTINNSVVDGTVVYNGTNAYNDGGAYIGSKNKSHKLLNQITFSFTSSGIVSGGAPRFSLPIDENNDGTTDGYAFIDAAGCGGISGATTNVSTLVATCAVFYDTSYANWAAFASAHPAYRMATDAVPFIIADGSFCADIGPCAGIVGNYVVSSIVLR